MYPVTRGRPAYQAHVQVREGLFEEEHGRDAFSGPCSHLYRLHPPTAWEAVEGPLRPHAFDLNKPALMASASKAWTQIMGNPDCAVYVHAPEVAPDDFLRDADGDLVYFIHGGGGILGSASGSLAYESGDYGIAPKGTTHRLLPYAGIPGF